MTQGHFERHLQRMREIYTERHEALIAAGKTELDGLMQFFDSQVGPQLIGWLAQGMSEAEVWRRTTARAIDTVALSSLTIERSMPPGLVFGIGAADAHAMRTVIRRLGRVLRVLAWQTKGASNIQNRVPAGSRDDLAQQTQPAIERRPRPERRSPGTAPTRTPQRVPMPSPRYR